MSEPNDMACAELADVATELALGVLTGRERAMAVAHLDECDTCREDVRQLMATGEQLLELLPPAEPPAGFETRVLERLGLPVPATQDATPPPVPRRGNGLRRRKSAPAAPPARPGGTRRVGRMRRTLAAVACIRCRGADFPTGLSYCTQTALRTRSSGASWWSGRVTVTARVVPARSGVRRP